jgi:hypothetical protein
MVLLSCCRQVPQLTRAASPLVIPPFDTIRETDHRRHAVAACQAGHFVVPHW